LKRKVEQHEYNEFMHCQREETDSPSKQAKTGKNKDVKGKKGGASSPKGKGSTPKSKGRPGGYK
jgi:hypothetical protein